jgi:hypothetical protein
MAVLVVFLGLLACTVVLVALGALLGLLFGMLLTLLWMAIGQPGIWGGAVLGALLGGVLFAAARVTPQGRLEISPRGGRFAGSLVRPVHLSGSMLGAVIGTVLGALIWLCGGNHNPQRASMLLGALMGPCFLLAVITRRTPRRRTDTENRRGRR